MGMSGGGGSKSSSVSGSAQKWAQPYAKAGASAVQGVFNANQPGLQKLTDLTTQNLVPSRVGQYDASKGNVGLGNAFMGDVLSGKYLNGNPHLQQMIDQSSSDILNNVNSQFSSAGRYGSGAHNQVLGRELANMESNLRYQNYTNEMQRMGQATELTQQQNAQDYQQALSAIGAGAELPYVGSSNLADSLGALFAGGKEKSKTKGPGLMSGLLSAGASVGSAAIMACDARLKENIVLNHVDPDGLAFYDFTYKPGHDLPKGVQTRLPMAQDVAVLRPWALGPVVDGYLTICPDKL